MIFSPNENLAIHFNTTIYHRNLHVISESMVLVKTNSLYFKLILKQVSCEVERLGKISKREKTPKVSNQISCISIISPS